VLYRQGQFEQAFEHMEQALAAAPDDPILNEHMGDILSALGLKQKALDYYLKASLKAVKPLELEKKIDAIR
jgi:tetratricopeptide (TPR) repeat protein